MRGSWLGGYRYSCRDAFCRLALSQTRLCRLRADAGPSWFESTLAVTALEASAARHATKQDNPIQPAEANLIDGARLYRDKCADCRTFRCRGCGSKGKLRQLTIEIGWGVPADSVQ
jgi:hypothetical protein